MDEQSIGQVSTFKQVMAYVDQLHEDIGKMAILIEQLMEEEGYATELGSRCSWALTNSYNQPTRWRCGLLESSAGVVPAAPMSSSLAAGCELMDASPCPSISAA